MNCIELKRSDFTEQILTGNFYSYYCIEYSKYNNKRGIAFVSVDFQRKISNKRDEILLVDYQRASETYLNTNIPFGEYPPFLVGYITPKDVRCFFEVNDKSKEFIKECIDDYSEDIYHFFDKYLEILNK